MLINQGLGIVALTISLLKQMRILKLNKAIMYMLIKRTKLLILSHAYANISVTINEPLSNI